MYWSVCVGLRYTDVTCRLSCLWTSMLGMFLLSGKLNPWVYVVDVFMKVFKILHASVMVMYDKSVVFLRACSSKVVIEISVCIGESGASLGRSYICSYI